MDISGSDSKSWPTTTTTSGELEEILQELGVDVFEPESKKEMAMADALDAFACFVLEEEPERCQSIIERHMNSGSSAGVLQGGNEEHDIYRITLNVDGNVGGAAEELLREFRGTEGKRYASVLTTDKLQRYMLGMCERRGRNYTRLGNLMFILAFGPTHGQVRHIDNMEGNLQICLYMSRDCPSTVLYAPEGPAITNGAELVEYWNTSSQVPNLIETMLVSRGDAALKAHPRTAYFAHWGSINATLRRFGKLYQPIARRISVRTDPGTTLVAGGNEVHAGPPTIGPRMFAFAIGIPEDSDNDKNMPHDNDNEDNDGEVQYSPLLLHVDLCCILFEMMTFDYPDRADEHADAKQYLLRLLLDLVQEYPRETYAQNFPDDRDELKTWIGNLVATASANGNVDSLLQQAVESDSIFYSPKTKKKKRRTPKKTKKNQQTRTRQSEEQHT